MPSNMWEDRHSEVVDALRSRALAVEQDQDVLRQRAANKVSTISSSMGSHESTVFMKPTKEQVDEQWARALVKKGLALDLVDDPEFRHAVLLTARAGQGYVDAQKSVSRLPHRTTMSTSIIPTLDVKVHAEISRKVYGLIKETGAFAFASGLIVSCRWAAHF
jgi:hypothetical protein